MGGKRAAGGGRRPGKPSPRRRRSGGGEPALERTVIIDGYNLILRSPAFRPDERRDLAATNPERALAMRNRLLQVLAERAGPGRVDTVESDEVFDEEMLRALRELGYAQTCD